MSSTDVFLSHNWDTDELGRDNHARVARINDALKLHGYKTWFDHEEMYGDITSRMAEGIEKTKAVIVFLTRKYYEKVNGEDERDNCKKEFRYSTQRKTRSKMIAVIMDSSMKKTSSWEGTICMYLCDKMFIDMSEDVEDLKYLNSKIQLLSKELKKIGIEPDDAGTASNKQQDAVCQITSNYSNEDVGDDVNVVADENNDNNKTTNVSSDFDSYTEADIKRLILNEDIKKLKSISSQWPNVVVKSLGYQTTLLWASRDGRADIVKLLINNGANVNVVDSKNQAPLHWASRNGYADVVETLIKSGANVNVVDSFNQTPLHKASRDGQADVVKILINSGANVNVVDCYNQIPLHKASRRGHAEVVEIFKMHGANVDRW